jgi:antirestriction protein ArdC
MAVSAKKTTLTPKEAAMNTSKTEEVKQLIEQGLATLVENLEHGKSDQLLAYIAAMAKFHRYSFRNIMLIVSQFPTATQVAGFRAWKKLDRYVKKGEEGITIIAPMIYRNARDGESTVPEDEPRIRFRAAHVFDLSQTEGEPLPHPAEVGGNPRDYTERLKKLIATKNIVLEYSNDLGNAEGASSGGKIRMRPDLSPAAEFSVLVHELAHETLHWNDQRLVTSKTTKETEAEAVAFIVSRAIGLNTNSASSDYIQIYDGTVETLEASLDAIRKTASEIIIALAPGAE